ncbi:DNA/RNA non-specific endonuclease [Vagococcus sp. CY53-2]|uniref:DNA/RNA non-specific endonuclease n=1 Tax=Vagococcus sp. CY53-2 TaxID=2925780 RepID=UPI001F5103A9|nr:DNA/RNA non-specific endonuclease [Vagococcus sp. CY53-2]MCI0130274.1 DNA/RNA non-specific endonuclease [Vagococcus sp. CY53-2]
MKKKMKKWALSALLLTGLITFGGCVADKTVETSDTSVSSSVIKESTVDTSSKEKEELAKKEVEEKVKQAEIEKKKKEEQASQLKNQVSDLANLEYEGTQTINVNDGVPSFSDEELSLSNGAWEIYGDLDGLNRATSANAMLNQSLMPTGKRESISSVTPTGWKNKKIEGGYLFNRSHLIGWALAGENANWKNLITGTRQLNSPEMLRHEMDVKHYLEQNSDNYVRYRVTPVFRGEELLARGVQMEAQSIGNDTIKFNVYIFNIQDGIDLNYADGSSSIGERAQENEPSQEEHNITNHESLANDNDSSDDMNQVFVTPTGKKYHTHAHGRGNFTPSTLGEAKKKGLEPCNICY